MMEWMQLMLKKRYHLALNVMACGILTADEQTGWKGSEAEIEMGGIPMVVWCTGMERLQPRLWDRTN